MVQNPRKAIYIARNGQLVLYLDTPTCPYSAAAAARVAVLIPVVAVLLLAALPGSKGEVMRGSMRFAPLFYLKMDYSVAASWI